MVLLEENKGKIPSQALPKEERLTSKKLIEDLFKNGSSCYLHPFRLLYLVHPDNEKQNLRFPQVLFSIPKRNFKKAVDRNRIRRQLKEIYRKHKNEFFGEGAPNPSPACLAILFTSKEKISFELLEKKLILIFLRLKEAVNNK
jgi:ribonuclease P protein component